MDNLQPIYWQQQLSTEIQQLKDESR